MEIMTQLAKDRVRGEPIDMLVVGPVSEEPHLISSKLYTCVHHHIVNYLSCLFVCCS